MTTSATLEPPPLPAAEAAEDAGWFTTEQLLALPEDDGMDRELIRGELHEEPMTYRTFSHSRLTVKIAHVLQSWLDAQPAPRGVVLGGEAGFRVRRGPDTTVGIDVAYISAEQHSALPRRGACLVEGVPVLAVEILSPSDRTDRVYTKIADYLQAGVGLVWLVEPVFETLTVYRPDAEPELFNKTHELSAEPHLPGFRVAVAEIFA